MVISYFWTGENLGLPWVVVVVVVVVLFVLGCKVLGNPEYDAALNGNG